uniref:(northern house mosquito) hypothetical protein n=1 Tax=Culex pipiens TaxID=7175 RepID=A0A8D8C0P4_CULPI
MVVVMLILVLEEIHFGAFGVQRTGQQVVRRTVVDAGQESVAGQVKLGQRLTHQPVVVVVVVLLGELALARHHRLLELFGTLRDFRVDQRHGRVQRAQLPVQRLQVGLHRRRALLWTLALLRGSGVVVNTACIIVVVVAGSELIRSVLVVAVVQILIVVLVAGVDVVVVDAVRFVGFGQLVQHQVLVLLLAPDVVRQPGVGVVDAHRPAQVPLRVLDALELVHAQLQDPLAHLPHPQLGGDHRHLGPVAAHWRGRVRRPEHVRLVLASQTGVARVRRQGHYLLLRLSSVRNGDQRSLRINKKQKHCARSLYVRHTIHSIS